MFFVKLGLILFLICCITDFIDHCGNDRNEPGYMTLFRCVGEVSFFIVGVIAVFQVWHISIVINP